MTDIVFVNQGGRLIAMTKEKYQNMPDWIPLKNEDDETNW
jgi:hypothetical protein